MSELAAYAKEKYNIDEDHKWMDFKAYSVLAVPQSKKWAALLMRRENSKTGKIEEVCDIKCETSDIQKLNASYLSEPFRMKGKNWTGVKFTDKTDKEVVFGLLDKALEHLGEQPGFRVVLDNSQSGEKSAYRETAIPKYFKNMLSPKTGEKKDAQVGEAIPEQIIKLRRLMKENAPLKPGEDYIAHRAKAFYEEAVLMEDYEDDAPSSEYFFNYYPTYDLLNTKALRGYFTWRAKVRAGEYPHITPSLAYIYLYELLNGIGASSPEDALKKLDEFENGFLEEGRDIAAIRSNLARWKFEFCIINDLPLETALKYANPKTTEKENALIVLKNPNDYSDKELFDSLMVFAEKARANTPVISKDEKAAHRIFADSWRNAQSFNENGKSLFELCFGKMTKKKRYPLYNAVYYNRLGDKKSTYKLNEARIYEYDGKSWYMTSYDRIYFDIDKLRGFLHETDRRARLCLKTGRNLKEKTDEKWAAPFIEAAVAEYEKERIKAARPRIKIEAANLAKIRRDAARTRENLLTDEERMEDAAVEAVQKTDYTSEELKSQTVNAPSPLNETQTAVLKALLNGGSVEDVLKKSHMMPSIAADEINSALYDLIGDNVIETEGDCLTLLGDYKEDVERIIKGAYDG